MEVVERVCLFGIFLALGACRTERSFVETARPESEARVSTPSIGEPPSAGPSTSVEGTTTWLVTDVSNPSEVIALDTSRFAVSMGCYHGGGCATRLPGSVEILEVTEKGEAKWTRQVRTGGYPGRLAYDAERERLFVCDGDENGRLFVISTGRGEELETRTLGEKGACSDVKVRDRQLFATDSARKEISIWDDAADERPSCVKPTPRLRGGPSVPIAMNVKGDELLLLAQSADFSSSVLFSLPLSCSGEKNTELKPLALLGPAANQVERLNGTILALVSGGGEAGLPALQPVPGDAMPFPRGSNPYHFATDEKFIYATLFAANHVVRRPIDGEGAWTDVPGLILSQARATSPSGIARSGRWLVTTFVQMQQIDKKLRFGGLVGITEVQP